MQMGEGSWARLMVAILGVCDRHDQPDSNTVLALSDGRGDDEWSVLSTVTLIRPSKVYR